MANRPVLGGAVSWNGHADDGVVLRSAREAAKPIPHWISIVQDGVHLHLHVNDRNFVDKGPKHLLGAPADKILALPGKREVRHHPAGHVPKGHDRHPNYGEHHPPVKGKDKGPKPLGPTQTKKRVAGALDDAARRKQQVQAAQAAQSNQQLLAQNDQQQQAYDAQMRAHLGLPPAPAAPDFSDPDVALQTVLGGAQTFQQQQAAVRAFLARPEAEHLPAALADALERRYLDSAEDDASPVEETPPTDHVDADGEGPTPQKPPEVREAQGWISLKDASGQVAHVYVGHGGQIEQGPAHLRGANIAHLPPAPARPPVSSHARKLELSPHDRARLEQQAQRDAAQPAPRPPAAPASVPGSLLRDKPSPSGKQHLSVPPAQPAVPASPQGRKLVLSPQERARLEAAHPVPAPLAPALPSTPRTPSSLLHTPSPSGKQHLSLPPASRPPVPAASAPAAGVQPQPAAPAAATPPQPPQLAPAAAHDENTLQSLRDHVVASRPVGTSVSPSHVMRQLPGISRDQALAHLQELAKRGVLRQNPYHPNYYEVLPGHGTSAPGSADAPAADIRRSREAHGGALPWSQHAGGTVVLPVREATPHWVTIENEEGITTHIFIGPGGLVTKGPRHLVGANIAHLPPGPGRTVTHHAEGKLPGRGWSTHPDYHEWAPPPPLPGKPNARLSGAPQTRQDRTLRPLSREDAEQGYRTAVARAAGPGTPSPALPAHPMTAAQPVETAQSGAGPAQAAPPEAPPAASPAAQVWPETPPQDASGADVHLVEMIVDAAKTNEPHLLQMYSQAGHDLETGAFPEGIDRPTLALLHERLGTLMTAKGYTQPSVPTGGGAGADDFNQSKLPYLKALPAHLRARARATLERAASAGVALHGMTAPRLRALAQEAQGGSDGADAWTSQQMAQHVHDYHAQGRHQSAPELAITREGPADPHPEKHYESALGALPDAHRHLLAAVGTRVHVSSDHNPGVNGEMDVRNGDISLYGPATRFTAVHEAGHGIDRALGHLTGSSEAYVNGKSDFSGWRSHAPDVLTAFYRHRNNWRLRPNMRSAPHEFFADAYAMAHDGAGQRAKLDAVAPDVAALMHGVDREVEMHVGH